jgi:hypothetical protein
MCMCARPYGRLGGAVLVARVLQMVSEPTLALARTVAQMVSEPTLALARTVAYGLALDVRSQATFSMAYR